MELIPPSVTEDHCQCLYLFSSILVGSLALPVFLCLVYYLYASTRISTAVSSFLDGFDGVTPIEGINRVD